MATIDAPTTARTLAFQGLANAVVRGLLCTPLVSRAIGRRLLVVYVVGRKTGARYSVPVAYLQDGADLLVGTPFGWARNLRTGDPVTVRYRGRRRLADVDVRSDEAGVVPAYTAMARVNHQFAKFNKIAIDVQGEPDSGDVRRSCQGGARVVRLTVR